MKRTNEEDARRRDMVTPDSDQCVCRPAVQPLTMGTGVSTGVVSETKWIEIFCQPRFYAEPNPGCSLRRRDLIT
jgi:hypothetical protein